MHGAVVMQGAQAYDWRFLPDSVSGSTQALSVFVGCNFSSFFLCLYNNSTVNEKKKRFTNAKTGDAIFFFCIRMTGKNKNPPFGTKLK